MCQIHRHRGYHNCVVAIQPQIEAKEAQCAQKCPKLLSVRGVIVVGRYHGIL
jgi:hypothetical protein